MGVAGRNRSGVTIFDVKGKLTIGGGDIELREAVLGALEAGSQKILLNLQGVTLMDSSGVGELVSSYTTVTNRGGRLKLENLPAKIDDILQITQLITVFDVYDDEDEAIASF